MTEIEQLYSDLAMFNDLFQMLENLEHEVKSNSLTLSNEKILIALRQFHTIWLKDQ